MRIIKLTKALLLTISEAIKVLLLEVNCTHQLTSNNKTESIKQ